MPPTRPAGLSARTATRPAGGWGPNPCRPCSPCNPFNACRCGLCRRSPPHRFHLDTRPPPARPTRPRRGASRGGAPHWAVFCWELDTAGDEGTHNPAALATGFLPAFEACLPITIHAGEGESPENIWQAAYHLHADRIGHGLTLTANPQLAARFRDRGICLELCPSSNREVVGFADPAFPASTGHPAYPLRDFIHAGLPLTLCTDNPGISRTTLAGEYLAAARMTPGGITLWEALALVRQAFVHAFLPSAEREILMKKSDQQVFAFMTGAQQ
ncbi:MAG: hypothetical protein IPH54_15430 [Rhodoferax sp.]|nr:hypothetical protein [Rhodoferax sp.]